MIKKITTLYHKISLFLSIVFRDAVSLPDEKLSFREKINRRMGIKTAWEVSNIVWQEYKPQVIELNLCETTVLNTRLRVPKIYSKFRGEDVLNIFIHDYDDEDICKEIFINKDQAEELVGFIKEQFNLK